MTTDRADRQTLAQVIQQMWKRLNVGVNIQFLYGRGLFQACEAGGPLYCRTYDAAIYTLVHRRRPGLHGPLQLRRHPHRRRTTGPVRTDVGWCTRGRRRGPHQGREGL